MKTNEPLRSITSDPTAGCVVRFARTSSAPPGFCVPSFARTPAAAATAHVALYTHEYTSSVAAGVTGGGAGIESVTVAFAVAGLTLSVIT